MPEHDIVVRGRSLRGPEGVQPTDIGSTEAVAAAGCRRHQPDRRLHYRHHPAAYAGLPIRGRIPRTLETVYGRYPGAPQGRFLRPSPMKGHRP